MGKNSVKKKNNTNRYSVLKELLITTAANILLCLIICLIAFAADINVYSNYFIILALLGLGVFLSGYYIGRRHRRNGIWLGILYNLPFIFLVLFSSIILSRFYFDSRTFITVFVLLLFSASGGIISVNTRKKR